MPGANGTRRQKVNHGNGAAVRRALFFYAFFVFPLGVQQASPTAAKWRRRKRNRLERLRAVHLLTGRAAHHFPNLDTLADIQHSQPQTEAAAPSLHAITGQDATTTDTEPTAAQAQQADRTQDTPTQAEPRQQQTEHHRQHQHSKQSEHSAHHSGTGRNNSRHNTADRTNTASKADTRHTAAGRQGGSTNSKGQLHQSADTPKLPP